MYFFNCLLVVCLFIVSCIAVDLTCPKSIITSQTPTGAFPSEGSAQFPESYLCDIEFRIPTGSILKLTVQNNILYTSEDSFVIQDSVSMNNPMYNFDSVFYAPATKATVQIATKSSTSTIYFTWWYMDVSLFKRVQNPTGSIVSLNLTANNYYRITSEKDNVVFHTGSIKGNLDGTLANIYVYDGDDLDSNYIGNLRDADIDTVPSTGRSITLVNFYNSSSMSYGIANDYSAISGFEKYSLFVLTKETDFFIHGTSSKGKKYAATLYSIDSDESSISYINFLNANNSGQEVRFKPMAPMNGFENLLTYNVRDSSFVNLPQQILTNTFTMSMYQCDVYIGIHTRPSIDWSNANPGRSGSIISPSIWNPTSQVISPYSTNFTSTAIVKFIFDIQSVVVGKPGDKLRIEVGSPSTTPTVVEFSQSVTNTGQKVAHGTYMTTSFTGASQPSSFSMKFNVETAIETTTKVTATVKKLAVFVLVFVNLF